MKLFKLAFFATFPSWIVFFILMIPFIFGSIIPYGLSILSFVILAWLFVVGMALQEKLPSDLRISAKLFIFNLIYVFVYVLITDSFFALVSPYLIPFHLLAVYSIFYALYFVSKSIVMAEEKKVLRFDRYLGTIFLFWFFPIGVWFVQPRLRKILQE